ncbi:MAG: patatin-like phospholipase family protein [Ferruginibacter sp.]
MKKIRILSIDGGGIRGILPGTILTYIEKQLQKKDKSQLKIGDYFDLVAGTSTGGILSCIYLCPNENGTARYSAADALDLYLNNGGDIFHTGLLENLSRGFGLFDEKYSVKALERELKKFFGDNNLDEFIKPCLITSYEITERNAHFFTSIDAKCDAMYNFKVHDVARATSAAPTYFEPASINSLAQQQFSLIDGGLFANNPALCAYAEARKIKFSEALKTTEKPDEPTAKDMVIVSIGTGSVKKPYHYKKFKNAGELTWINPIIDILMSANAETVHYQVTQMYKTLSGGDEKNYYRLEPSLREAFSEMDYAGEDNLVNLHQAGLWYINKNKVLLDEIVDKLLDNK